MKKFLVAAFAVLTMTAGVFAGGDVTTLVEPVVVQDKNIYVGVGITGYNNYLDGDKDFTGDTLNSEISEGIDAKLGYTFYRLNDIKVSLEGQAGTSLWGFVDDLDGSPSTYNYGAYIKPEYAFNDAISAYALLGYAKATVDLDGYGKEDTTGFSYGIGGAYAFTDSVSAYLEYVMLPAFSEDGFDDINNDKTTFGVAYAF